MYKRQEIAFFDFSPKNIKNNKVYFLYLTLNLLKEKFGELFEFEFNFIRIEIIEEMCIRDRIIGSGINISFNNIIFFSILSSPIAVSYTHLS